MESITVLDFAFGVVTTLLLGALTVVQFLAERRRQKSEREATARMRSFEDTQFALDIQASASSAEVLGLLAKKPLAPRETEFLVQTHAIAQARLDAMDKFTELDETQKQNVEQALQRLMDVVGDIPDAQVRQAAINKKYGTKVGTDRSRYVWDGSGQFNKYEILHLIGQRFIERHGIATRQEFDKQFGGAVTGVLGTELVGRKFDTGRLLDVIAATPKYADRDLKLVAEHGAITFSGVDYRTGWGLGFAVFPDMGRLAQIPVIEHFRRQPGYDIDPL